MSERKTQRLDRMVAALAGGDWADPSGAHTSPDIVVAHAAKLIAAIDAHQHATSKRGKCVACSGLAHPKCGRCQGDGIEPPPEALCICGHEFVDHDEYKSLSEACLLNGCDCGSFERDAA